MSTAQYVQAHPDHRVGVRLGQLLSLLDRADVDPLFRQEIVHIPSDHPTFRWRCAVHGCQRHPATSSKLCSLHAQRWRRADRDWLAFAAFIAAEEPLIPLRGGEQPRCIICPERPARGPIQRLCVRHGDRWHHAVGFDPSLAFEQWVLSEEAFPGFGSCLVTACEDLAESPLLLCRFHRLTYQRHDSPGGASLPSRWARFYDGRGKPTPVSYVDEDQFRRWCARAPARLVVGQLNLLGLRPLARAEIQWTLVKHTEGDRTQWRLPLLQGLVNICRERDLNSVADLDVAALRRPHQAIVTEMLNELRLIYFTPAQTREAGFIETDHFGVRFTQRQSHYDLTDITQRWLRDLVWDVMADLLRSPRCPRSGGTFDGLRRGAVSLSAFLEAEVSGAGHDPTVLRAEHMHRFLADMRHRERHGLLARGIHRRDGRPSIVTAITRMYVFSTVHRLFRFALDSGAADRLGLDRHFILAARPEEGINPRPRRRPFPDDVAQALTDEANLQQLAGMDRFDSGLRDIWEAIVATGRRGGEVVNLRLDCLGRYHDLPMLWHDQTKVSNFDQAIRIPESLYRVLTMRQDKTIARFTRLHGRAPTEQEKSDLALFPRRSRNRSGTKAMSYGWYSTCFRAWVKGLDLGGHYVTHQARHTLATKLLRHGAGLHHIRRYLGHVSVRMAEHYAQVALSDIEDVLHHVWVSGPGADNPGELLCDGGTTMTRQEAEALAVNLTRRSTPTEGGFCTFQPVVDGGACPWNLDCHNCKNFVLSGADLLYWRRKREQWASHAERAPTDEVADYLHSVFEPTARAIDGLESALSALGLLDKALALDLRRPQDYFQRVWSIGFRASQLAAADPEGGDAIDLDELDEGLEEGA